MTKPTTLQEIADTISAGLPGEPMAAAHAAMSVAAAKCIDADVTDDEAARFFRTALRNVRGRLARRRAH